MARKEKKRKIERKKERLKKKKAIQWMGTNCLSEFQTLGEDQNSINIHDIIYSARPACDAAVVAVTTAATTAVSERKRIFMKKFLRHWYHKRRVIEWIRPLETGIGEGDSDGLNSMNEFLRLIRRSARRNGNFKTPFSNLIYTYDAV